MLATEQECHDKPMQEVIRESRLERAGVERGSSEGLWEFSLKGVKLKGGCTERTVNKCSVSTGRGGWTLTLA